MTFLTQHMIAVWLAYLLDKWFGDPRWMPHPVIGFGNLITKLDRLLNRANHRKVKGLIAWMIIAIIAFVPAFYLLELVYEFNVWIGLFFEVILIFTTIAEKSLAQAGRDVEQPLVAADLEMAREKVSWIVGRDTENLTGSEVARATIETVAENTSDGVTAPMFYAFIGGAPLALLYRAINTCDSMLGYKNEKYAEFGYASARFDDLFNLIPSRVTGFLMIFCNHSISNESWRNCFRILVRDARKHPSPNSGWCEAAMASLLQIQLGGRNTYKGQISERAKMGEPIGQIEVHHIDQCIKMMKRTNVGFMIMMTIGVVLLDLACTRS